MRDAPYFKPGDKVMRVDPCGRKGSWPYDHPTSPRMGVIYCVEDFYEGPKFNAVMLVGFGGWRYHPPNGTPVGWDARAFRKVEEIKLCVEAANRLKAPIEVKQP